MKPGGISPHRAAVAVLLMGFAAMLALNAPGQLSYDSVEQLAEGRAGFYNSWHPPVMAWLLGLFDSLIPGALLFLVFQSLLLLAALLLLLRLGPRGWASVAVAAGIMASPQWLLYQGDIWKDLLFADSAIAGFACLAWYGQSRRWPALLLATLLLVLAASARQNGLLLLPVAGGTLALMARRQGRSAWYGFVFFLALLACTAAIGFGLAVHADGGDGARAEIRRAQSYDLAGAFAKDPSLTLRLAPELDHLLRSRGPALYSPLSSDPFAADPAISQALSEAPAGMIANAWESLVRGHPWLYLRIRWPVFKAVLTSPDPLVCHVVQVGISGPPALLRRLGLKPGIRPQDQALADYAKLFFHTPVLSHLAWGGLAVLLLVLLLRQGTSADLAVAGLVAGALLFSLSFAVISIACDYRYLLFLDLSAMAALLYVLARR